MQNNTSFEELSKPPMTYQNLYNYVLNSLQHESQAVKRNHAVALLLFNSETDKGIKPSPDNLIQLDEQLDSLRDIRITRLHKIMNDLAPVANEFMAFYDVLFDKLQNRSISHEYFCNCLQAYRELFKIGGDLALYQTNQAQLIRRAIAKYL